jgi:hypothetical protein
MKVVTPMLLMTDKHRNEMVLLSLLELAILIHINYLYILKTIFGADSVPYFVDRLYQL